MGARKNPLLLSASWKSLFFLILFYHHKSWCTQNRSSLLRGKQLWASYDIANFDITLISSPPPSCPTSLSIEHPRALLLFDRALNISTLWASWIHKCQYLCVFLHMCGIFYQDVIPFYSTPFSLTQPQSNCLCSRRSKSTLITFYA